MKRASAFVGIIIIPLLLLKILEISFAEPIALLITTILLWITEVVPLPVTGFLIPCLSVIFGIVDSRKAFSPFGSDIIGLFLGTFLCVKGLTKYGLDQRIASAILRKSWATKTPGRLAATIALLCWLLGMWMSNTATCIVMLPVCTGILCLLQRSLQQDQLNIFSSRLLLTCAFVPSIGGMVTPVGSMPNAIAIHSLTDYGIRIGFLRWVALTFPVSILLLGAALLILHRLYPLRPEALTVELSTSIPLNQFQRRTQSLLIGIFSLLLALWVVPELLKELFPSTLFFDQIITRVPLGVPPLFAAALLFTFNDPQNSERKTLLTWEDAKEIDWGSIVLFGGGLCLGSVLSQSGFTKHLATEIIGNPTEPLLLLSFIIPIFATLFSEVSSNTATAAFLIPLVAQSSQHFSLQGTTGFVLGAVFGAGLGFMLPVSTPPNAMVFATGKIRLREMMLSGALLDIAGIIIVGFFSYAVSKIY